MKDPFPLQFPLSELYDPEKEKQDFWSQVRDSEKKLIRIEAEYDIPDQEIQLQKLIKLYKSILQDVKAVIKKRRQEDLFGGYDDGIRTRIIRDGKLEEWLTTGSLSVVEDSCPKAIVTVKRKIALLQVEEKREPHKNQQKKIKYQDYIEDKNVLRDILEQLALSGNMFVDAETSKNWDLIYENHFKDPDLICDNDPKTRINWIGTWGEYRMFFDYAREYKVFKGRNFNENLKSKQAIFFESHCLFYGEYKTNKQVSDGYSKSRPDINKIKNLNTILKKYSNLPS
jgi:hypothetical protein